MNIAKKLLLITAAFCLLAGCAKPEPAPAPQDEPPRVTMGNPWSSWDTLAAAEEAVGFSLDLPETVGTSYEAEVFRVMNGAATVLEVTYRDGDTAITVRKSPGEGQDIAGVYGFDYSEECQWQSGKIYTVYREKETETEPCALYLALDHDGYSWSVYAPNGFAGDAAQDFLSALYE